MPTSTSALPGTTILNLAIATNLDGSEYFPLVQGGTTKRATLSMAGSAANNPLINTFITAGSSYNSVATDQRILVNKAVGSATDILLTFSSGYAFPVLVKDLRGDADVNNITVTFSGGQTMDGLASVVITAPFGYFWFNPLSSGNWYDASY